MNVLTKYEEIVARMAADEAEWNDRHPEAIVTVRYSKFRVTFNKGRPWFDVYCNVKGHWRRTVSGLSFDSIPRTGKSRVAIARALFPQAAGGDAWA